MVEALAAIAGSNDAAFSEGYKRCALVLTKLIGQSFSKHMLWPYGRIESPDYYKEIKNPLMLSSVAAKLATKAYGSGQDEGALVSEFYADLRQVVSNGLCFFSETGDYVIKTLKLFHCMFRHVHLWLLSSSRPPLNKCSDEYCALSGVLVKQVTAIKCSHCYASFCTDGLALHKDGPYLVRPVDRHMDTKYAEDWFCPFCVREDSTAAHKSTQPSSSSSSSSSSTAVGAANPLGGSFFISEVGASGLVPWQFNTTHSSVIDTALHHQGGNLFAQLEALRVLADANLSPIVSDAADQQTEATSTGSTGSTGSVSSWSVADRLTVLGGLVALIEHLGFLPESVSKEALVAPDSLVQSAGMRRWDSVKQAEFLVKCQEVSGKDGALFARGMLALIDSEAEDADPSSGRRTAVLFDMEKHRTRDVEDHLSNLVCDAKAEADPDRDRSKGELPALVLAQLKQRDLKTRCKYCNMLEDEVCSPLVLGHTLEEHDNHMALFAASPANFDVPYMPFLSSINGEALVSEYKKQGVEPLVAHQYCALSMFQLRAERLEVSLRRRRRLVAQRVIELAGLTNTPVGVDDAGREFWRFPVSRSIFVCSAAGQQQQPPCPVRRAF